MAVGKQRLDKYYNLAKEKGYRARSAFKLLELNRKFGFLQDAHIAVDLCAAPGGWMQILAQEMPRPRKIIGVDLDPIKPLGGDVVSFVGDITTAECRKTLIGLLEGHQVDVFVHDGAPNFGTSKEKDHFVQNDLVLHALKLSSEFLKAGGTFVTKIHRSENYAKIVKVLNGLFGSVDVTKPLSSRSESAEIFAVCRAFKDPEYVDPALFDSSLLFREEAVADEHEYRKILLSDFIRSTDPRVLQGVVQIVPDFECSLITAEMLCWFTDLKLVHPRDIRRIMERKAKILIKAKKGLLAVPQLADLAEAKAPRGAAEEEEEESYDALEEINTKLDKEAKKERRMSRAQMMPAHDFYDDRIFDDFESVESVEVDEPAEVEEIEVSSCSDSMEMTESEMRCLLYMKEAGEEKFLNGTIDRYLVDEDDIVLPFEKRPSKADHPKVEKKKIEVVGRKRARALRRANKVMSDIAIEDEEEEAVVYKKVFKSALKKQRQKLRLVYARKGERFSAPKGRGRIQRLDRRMKHDLKLEKRRARANK
ncbi:AdoMet-dependent rRNA methyltransferase SPB1 [Pancytospora philotis]|nr:AdoMet-dependent rRNA methyltransferase SPB1 [Pancytospora philotis]